MSGGSIREDRPGPQPHETAEQHAPAWLALKFALACFLVAALAKLAGYSNPTTGIISAAFLVASGPVESLRSAGARMAALAIGVILGIGGAFWALPGEVVPLLFFPLLGAAAGVLATWSRSFIYVTVIGVVVATTGVDAEDGVWATAAEVAVQVAISCFVAPAVVWAAEKAHATWRERRR